MKKSRKTAEQKNAEDYAGSRYATQKKVLSPSARADMKKYLAKKGNRKKMEDAQDSALKKRRKRRKAAE